MDADFWEDLINLIEDGKVIPVIGAGVITREEDQALFYPWLARRLAERLGLALETLPPDPDLNAVATAYLLARGEGNVLYNRLSRIIRDELPTPGQALRDLASISAFNLFLTTTFDPLTKNALDLVRHGGSEQTDDKHAFAPGGGEKDLPARKRDLARPTVYYLLGKISSMPEYVVWEEDMLEFIFALHKEMPGMERLGRDLKDHGLLVLGLHFSDWVVRFFLRVAKQERLSTLRLHPAYLADGPPDRVPDSLVLFFGAVSREIHVMRQDPTAFCAELARRWKERHPAEKTTAKLTLPPIKSEMPRGAIFISYAREDESAAVRVVNGLRARGCTVWYDRERLKGGVNWQNSLQDEVMRRCGLFVALISRTTERAREGYYIRERNWAAHRAEGIAHSEQFYLPIVIDESSCNLSDSSTEPRAFHHIQAVRLPEGEVPEDYAAHVFALQQRAILAPL